MDPTFPNLPTPPEIPTPPAQPPEAPWPNFSGDQPPPHPPPSIQRPPWPLLAALSGGVVLILVVALVFSLLLRSGAATLLGAVADQTATADNTLATSTAEVTPPSNATGTAAPRSTASPHPLAPAVHVVSAQKAATAGSPVAVSCPKGELALSGGWKSDANTPIINSSRSGNGWRVSPLSSTGAPVTAYALCLQHVAGASITERSVTVAIGANKYGQNVADCNPGEIAIGGGFGVPASQGVILLELNLDLATDKGFRGGVANTTTSSRIVIFYTECLNASGARLLIPPHGSQFNLTSGQSTGAGVNCPQGMLLTGGGFSISGGLAAVLGFFPKNNANWQGDAMYTGSSNVSFTIYAMCLSFS